MLPNIKTFCLFFFPVCQNSLVDPRLGSENVGCTVEFETAVNQSWSPGRLWKSVAD